MLPSAPPTDPESAARNAAHHAALAAELAAELARVAQGGGERRVVCGVAGGTRRIGRRGAGEHRCIHGQRLTTVHSVGPV